MKKDRQAGRIFKVPDCAFVWQAGAEGTLHFFV